MNSKNAEPFLALVEMFRNLPVENNTCTEEKRNILIQIKEFLNRPPQQQSDNAFGVRKN